MRQSQPTNRLPGWALAATAAARGCSERSSYCRPDKSSSVRPRPMLTDPPPRPTKKLSHVRSTGIILPYQTIEPQTAVSQQGDGRISISPSPSDSGPQIIRITVSLLSVPGGGSVGGGFRASTSDLERHSRRLEILLECRSPSKSLTSFLERGGGCKQYWDPGNVPEGLKQQFSEFTASQVGHGNLWG